MWPDVPWQIDLLIVETIVSVVWASWYAYRGWRPTLDTAILMVIWNLAVCALIVWGGSPTWQHLTFGALQLWALAVSINRLSTLKGYEPSKNPAGATFSGVVLAMGLILLLVGGA